MRYTTHRGKEIELSCEGVLWHVYFTSGGQLPEELSGAFTSEGLARRAVEEYISKGKASKIPVERREQ